MNTKRIFKRINAKAQIPREEPDATSYEAAKRMVKPHRIAGVKLTVKFFHTKTFWGVLT